MRFRSSLFKIGAVLAILLSLSWCVYVLAGRNTSSGSQNPGQTQIQSQSPSSGGQTSPAKNGRLFGAGSAQPNNQAGAQPNFQPNSQGSSGRGQFRSNRSGSGQFPGGSFSRSRGMGGNTDTYTVPVTVYAIVFFLAVLAAYFALVRRKPGSSAECQKARRLNLSQGNRKLLVITVFCVGFFLRIVLAVLIPGFTSDLQLFHTWANSALNGLSQVYSASGRGSVDYPPLYIYVLYLIAKIGSWQALSPYFTLLLKLPSILADLGTAFLLAKLARKYLSPELSLLVAAFYIFNPAVFVNSAIWGQVDSFFTLIVVGGLVLLAERKLTASAILLTAAVLMKPQGIIFLPVLFFELVRRRRVKDFLKVLAAAVVTALVIVLPFSKNLNVLWIVKLFTSTLGEYPYASVNAFNLYYLLGANYKSDATSFLFASYHVWGTALIVLTTLIAWFVFARGKSKDFIPAAALILIAGVFIFSTRMHERYLFPAVALVSLAMIYLKDRRLILLTAGFSITSFANTYIILCQNAGGLNQAASAIIPKLTAAVNVILFLYLLKVVYDSTFKRSQPAIKDTGSYSHEQKA